MTFQPLTSDQYQSAINAGFKPDEIIQNEQIRKQKETVTEIPSTSSGGFFKSLLSAPATLIARPFQAGQATAQSVQDNPKINQYENDTTSLNKEAERLTNAIQQARLNGQDTTELKNQARLINDKIILAGTNIKPVLDRTQFSGGIIAEAPKNFKDVKKDVGRAVETVALGVGNPVLTGAAFGFGNSLEQGNDVFSLQTALNTALGAAGGKILDLVGKPIFNATGTIVGKVTPQTIKKIVSKGTEAIQEFAASHNILPDFASKAINTGIEKANNALDQFTSAFGNDIKKVGTTVKGLYTKEYPTITPTEAEVSKAQENIATQYQKVLPLTPTQKIKEAQLLANTGDNVYTTLARHGVNLGSDEAPAQLSQLSEKFSQTTKYAQANEHGYFNVDEIKHNAYQSIDENVTSEVGRQSAKKKIDQEIEALLGANEYQVHSATSGDRLIKSNLVERLRKTGNDWAQYNRLNPDTASNAAGRGLADAVRSQVEKQGSFPAYREANREWGKIIHAQDILGKIESSGKKFNVAGGLSGSIARKVLSGAFGYHTAGIGGAILSEVGTDYAAQILSNPELRTWFDRQIVNKFQGTNPTPEVLAKLSQQIKDFIDKQTSVLKLPSPQAIPLGPKTPSPSSVTSVSAKKGPIGVDPKSGQFKVTYKSSE